MSKKNIVALIKKMAQELPALPDLGAPTAPKKPSGDPDIISMQKAIKQLALDVVSQMKGRGGEDPTSQKEQSGRMSFGDFLARSFMRNSNVPAVEFSPDPNKKKIPEKDQTQANKMSWVMDTMQRIGNTNTEFVVDGVWGPRTQAALINVVAFASGLFKVAEAYGVHPRFYNPELLSQISQIANYSAEDFTAAQKNQNAKLMLPHINAIRKMYDEIKDQVLQTPQYQTYIERDTPYMQHEQENFFNPTPEQLAALRQTFPGFNIQIMTTDQGTRIGARITVDDLSSPEKFIQWIQSRVGDALEPNKVLEQVANQIAPVIQQLTPQQQQEANQQAWQAAQLQSQYDQGQKDRTELAKQQLQQNVKDLRNR